MSETLSVVESPVVDNSVVDNFPVPATFVIPTFENRFSRRGKGATGTITLQTIGKASSVVDGVTKELDHKHAVDYPTAALIAKISELYNVNECLAFAYDEFLRSDSGQTSERKVFGRKILAAGLAFTEAQAESKAFAWLKTLKDMADIGEPVSQEEWIRKQLSRNQAAANTQRATTNPAMAPRLVTNPVRS